MGIATCNPKGTSYKAENVKLVYILKTVGFKGTVIRVITGILSWVVRIGMDPDDDDDIRLQKSLLTFARFRLPLPVQVGASPISFWEKCLRG